MQRLDRNAKRNAPTSQPAIKKRAKGPVPIDVELFLQPWFVPLRTYLAIRRLLPSSQLAKMHYYFDDYGCLKCGRTDALYGSNGLCERCSVLVRHRVVISLKRRFKLFGWNTDVLSDDKNADRMMTARMLLRPKRTLGGGLGPRL